MMSKYGHHNSFQALKIRNMQYSYGSTHKEIASNHKRNFKAYIHVPYSPYLWPQNLLVVANISFEISHLEK